MSALIACRLAVRSTLSVGPAIASALAEGIVRPTIAAPASGTTATSASVQTRRIAHSWAQIEGHRRLWMQPEMVNKAAPGRAQWWRAGPDCAQMTDDGRPRRPFRAIEFGRNFQR